VHRYLETVVSSFKEALIFNVVGAAVALGAFVFFNFPLGVSFGLIILIESTGLMLVGGALGVAGGATAQTIARFLTRKKLDPKSIQTSDAKAALYALTGFMLFAEGALMSAVVA
jgi:hypothetical protein